MFTGAETIGILAVIGVAGFVARLSGFGFGLIVVPVMSLFIGPRDAVIISTFVGLVSSMNQAWLERAHADVATVHRLFVAACAGMPIGLAVFVLVPEHALRAVLGVTVVAAAAVLARGFTLGHASRRADLGLGFVSGILNTSVSTNGPPLVFLLQARQFEPPAFRGTISRVFAYSNIVSVLLFAAAGKVAGRAAVMSLVSLPVLFAMQWVGTRSAGLVRGDRFRVLVLVLLFLSGISAVASALR
ncbi:MAG: TSUP family transporter [Ilumatobacteraceae bacterium]